MLKIKLISLSLSLVFLSFNYCLSSIHDMDFKTGSEILISEKMHLIKERKIALITNRTAVLKDGTHIIDALLDKGINVVKIFTPEHGFGADDKYTYSGYDIPVISLYGNNKSFSKNDITDVDLIVYDIQDLGVRYYTYISTMYLTMQDAALFGIDYIVCDRPSVANLDYVCGYMLDPDFNSFVGMVPVPVMYGMTPGELCIYLRSDINTRNSDIDVIPMKGYSRNTDYASLNIPWIKPSPNIPSLESARLYPALCFIEGINVSEGRSTEYPFQQFGAPFINSEKLLSELNSAELPGILFSMTSFIPSDEFNVSSYPSKYMNRECYGIKLTLTDIKKFKPVETSVAILCALKKTTPDIKWISNNFIDKLAGTDKLRNMIDNGFSYNEIINSWYDEVNSFISEREKYLLY